jgi:hypothetical protein
VRRPAQKTYHHLSSSLHVTRATKVAPRAHFIEDAIIEKRERIDREVGQPHASQDEGTRFSIQVWSFGFAGGI